MRFTNVLFATHLGRQFRDHWRVQKKRRIIDMKAKSILEEKGFSVVEATSVVAPQPPSVDKRSFHRELKFLRPIPYDENHPDYHAEPCYLYQDHNALLEGWHQAKCFTNTVEMEANALPTNVENLIDAKQLPNQDRLVQKSVKASLIFDATQVKLPIRKNPLKPAWVYPRDYGIPDTRRNYLITSRLVQLCENASNLVSKRCVMQDAFFSVPLESGHIIQLELRADLLITSDKPLPSLVDPKETITKELVDLKPLLPTISFETHNHYQLRNIHPCGKAKHLSEIHTAIVHFNKTEVKNLYEEPVTESQILGRTLMKCYAFAVAQARKKYGDDLVELPKPITVQCVQTDSQTFHFVVFQLNTMKLTGDIHNSVWSLEPVQLFSDCDYRDARPVLEGYNPDVFKRLLAFYNSPTG